jgi:hypothetical protein
MYAVAPSEPTQRDTIVLNVQFVKHTTVEGVLRMVRSVQTVDALSMSLVTYVIYQNLIEVESKGLRRLKKQRGMIPV